MSTKKNGQATTKNYQSPLKFISSLIVDSEACTSVKLGELDVLTANSHMVIPLEENTLNAAVLSSGTAPPLDPEAKPESPPSASTQEERRVEQAQASLDGETADGLTTTPFDFKLLPNELQHEIFISVVGLLRNENQNCLRSMASLMMVAKRFYDWVLPCLYNTVSLSSNNTSFLETIQSRHNSPTFFTKHIRKLCLPYYIPSKDAELILSLCSDVVDLAFWVDYHSSFPGRSIVPLLTSFPLRRLNIEARHFESLFVGVNQPAWLHALSHLSIVYWNHDYPPELRHLDKLSSLTHLSLNVNDDHLTSTSLGKILSACKQLKLIAIYGQQQLLDQSVRPVDSRVVFTTYSVSVLREWELQANGLEGCAWKRAEMQSLAQFDAE
ncbi:hypothetical protein CPB83DRAFT_892760 [Crepidotus variabilis]|uniref:Uncharacterized protein n=1 Tax=Crepidotus variabilis TaxID=179855 RepID=A0A9P6EKX4_9AGAR|nr:hypothetical protein CPB83DRAFT_892760 [Crepidotus variabilis]